jgi:hypothetical protein
MYSVSRHHDAWQCEKIMHPQYLLTVIHTSLLAIHNWIAQHWPPMSMPNGGLNAIELNVRCIRLYALQLLRFLQFGNILSIVEKSVSAASDKFYKMGSINGRFVCTNKLMLFNGHNHILWWPLCAIRNNI